MLQGRPVVVDNRWVVPYNPYLLLRFNSHINIEYCQTVSVMKYLFKYITKGEDRVVIDETREHDEVHRYSVQRYDSSCNAAWKLLGSCLEMI